jgi:hypothetical protein
MRRKTTGWTFAAATALALGFGGVQAIAAPTAEAAPQSCKPKTCNNQCVAQGSIRGECTETGLCRCVF